MRTLLVNPFVERMHRELSFAENLRPPLGLAYCAAVLEENGREVEILAALALGIRFPALRAILERERPDLVGISTYTPTRFECFRTAAVVKEVLGEETVVVVGGPHASAAAEDTLREVPPIDFVVRGEGEHALLELLGALEGGGDPSRVPGISMRRGGEVLHAPERPGLRDLDRLPLPARHLLPMDAYGTRMPSTSRRCTTVLTSRGCPGRCIFCTRDWLSRDVRQHSAQRVVDEVEEIVGRWGLRGVIMQDDTFTLSKRRVHAICDELRARKLRIRWLATTRVDCVDLDLLESMKDAGCEVVTFGAESMNPETLEWLRKGFTVEQVRRAIDRANQAGLTVRASYLLGVGDESEEDIRRSAHLARQLRLDKLKANIGLSVYPGTPLLQMAIQAGVLPADHSFARGYEDPARRYGRDETPRWYTPHVARERLMELRRETEVNVLFTRPSAHAAFHKVRKLATRLRRHPRETFRHVARLARAVVRGSDLRDTPRS